LRVVEGEGESSFRHLNKKEKRGKKKKKGGKGGVANGDQWIHIDKEGERREKRIKTRKDATTITGERRKDAAISKKKGRGRKERGKPFHRK